MERKSDCWHYGKGLKVVIKVLHLSKWEEWQSTGELKVRVHIVMLARVAN